MNYEEWQRSEEFGEWLYNLPFEERKVIFAAEIKKRLAYTNRFPNRLIGLTYLIKEREENE